MELLKGHNKHILQITTIIIANLICSIAFNLFFIPNNLLSGGVGGISIILNQVFNVETYISVLIINIPLLIIAKNSIDNEFFSMTIFSILTFSICLYFTRNLQNSLQINDIFISSIMGGAINGIGMGLLFNSKSSQGGFDIIAAVVKKHFNIPLGNVLMGCNLIIIGYGAHLFSLRNGAYTIISMLVAYKIMDKIISGLNTKKTALIISKKSQVITDEIVRTLNRSATRINGTGAYSNDSKDIIYCTLLNTEMGKLKSIVDRIDKDAFFVVQDASEVIGKGFKKHAF